MATTREGLGPASYISEEKIIGEGTMRRYQTARCTGVRENGNPGRSEWAFQETLIRLKRCKHELAKFNLRRCSAEVPSINQISVQQIRYLSKRQGGARSL